MAQTSKESVEKKFKDVFERSPGAFPEGTSLEKKVNYIAKGTEALKAVKSKELENKMKNVAELSQKFESQKGRADEKVRQDFERIAELDQQYKGKGIFTSEKVAEPKSDKKLQDTPRKTTTAVKDLEHNTQKKTTEASVQTASEHDSQTVNPSVSKSSVKEKLNTEPDKKDNTPQPQENQKEEGFLSLLKRFVKKILEKFLGEGEKDVENARGMKEDAQRDTSNNEEQQKSKQLDEILKDKSVSEGLKQATKLENPAITPVNTPKVNEVNTGRER
ncbi:MULTISPECIES: hypothetical protein [Wolbachia]|uniref:hypothetical protein n=1 Tax=Wolbachia TaxID=953 RepID=UPI0002D878D4|nr:MULTISPECIES: hypothetical protein [Wolbachia]MDU8941625.1 hypothetical protein [Wolbachia endosymbiont of Drosophila malagassya]ERN56167.1 hypothetical protein WMELPOP_00472 [Wolbachia pipientis wMelPop]KAB2978556.1 hypothetical protein DEF52_00185 [Wolbachia endosymbiont of Nasonia oneida]MBA8752408.1 hypothetical protein [Wolbachia pipientis]MCE4149811.1 hypothetical protein [Wolbachia endosymbiont of Drosophila melanogaster]